MKNNKETTKKDMFLMALIVFLTILGYYFLVTGIQEELERQDDVFDLYFPMNRSIIDSYIQRDCSHICYANTDYQGYVLYVSKTIRGYVDITCYCQFVKEELVNGIDVR